MKAQVPAKLAFLYEPHRYKVIWGGRGKGASWGMADALLIRGAERPLRWLCARETQNSIEESVHAVLSGRIVALGLSRYYDVQRRKIISKTFRAQQLTASGEIDEEMGDFLQGGCGFAFAGIKTSPATIKSYDGFDGCWVEEAESVTNASWRVLRPTFRKDNCNIHGSGKPECSEIWISFNPKFDTDATYQEFVLNPPPDCVSVFMNWRDNPFFPEVLRVEMEDLKKRNFEEYEHVYEGKTLSAVQGAIYAEEIRKATADGRICSVPVDRTRPVNTVWDLGFGDKSAIWFIQHYGGWFNFVDYLEDSGKTLEWYVIQLQQRGYVYGTDWVPHDAVDSETHKRLVSNTGQSPEQLLRKLGRKVRIVQKGLVTNRINKGRTLFPQCRFDITKCDRGLAALKQYQWGPPSKDGVPKREPLHDHASHGADAFQQAALISEHLGDNQAKIQQPASLIPVGEGGWM